MKLRIAALLTLLMLLTTACAAQWQWKEELTPARTMRLSGIRIGIDPGHQRHANSDREPVAPNSKETKAKVSSGTQGVRTRIPEYETNLTVSLQLRDALEALGCEVYMTRETHDVDISNMERALMMNALNVDLVLRLHCNGSSDASDRGAGLYVTQTGDIAESSLRAAEALKPAILAATGVPGCGIYKRDSYTGQNWSTVPCVMVEMGYMSNPEEDELLNDPDYQQKMVTGLVEGICAFVGR